MPDLIREMAFAMDAFSEAAVALDKQHTLRLLRDRKVSSAVMNAIFGKGT